jgi:hypothetical protein
MLRGPAAAFQAGRVPSAPSGTKLVIFNPDIAFPKVLNIYFFIYSGTRPYTYSGS